MARLHRMLLGLLTVLVTNHTVVMGAVFTVPITNLTPADTGDHLVGDFDFGVSFSQVDSLDYEFMMPDGYGGTAPTIDNNHSRSLYVVILGTDDPIEFTNIGLGFPLASSLFANFSQIDPGESAGFHFQPLTPPISWPETLQQEFLYFVNSGHGRIMFVDIDLRLLELQYSASYTIPVEITQARITITGTPIPEPVSLLTLLTGGPWLAGRRKREPYLS